MSTSSSQPTNPSSYHAGEQPPYRAGEQSVYDHRDAPTGPNVPALVMRPMLNFSS